MTDETAEFSLHDAIEVLRLLDDDPKAAFDIRHRGFRFQCVRGTASSQAGAKETGDAAGEEPRRHARLEAPATGRFSGNAAVFSPGDRPVRVKAGTIVGHIQVGTQVTVVTTDVAGTVAHVRVTPDDFVEYGQTLLVIDVA
jgi:biotin carboxyl carrier protein